MMFLSIEDPEFLAFIPRPALALILFFPTSAEYEEYKAKEDASRMRYDGCDEDEQVVWYCALQKLLRIP